MQKLTKSKIKTIRHTLLCTWPIFYYYLGLFGQIEVAQYCINLYTTIFICQKKYFRHASLYNVHVYTFSAKSG